MSDSALERIKRQIEEIEKNNEEMEESRLAVFKDLIFEDITELVEDNHPSIFANPYYSKLFSHTLRHTQGMLIHLDRNEVLALYLNFNLINYTGNTSVILRRFKYTCVKKECFMRGERKRVWGLFEKKYEVEDTKDVTCSLKEAEKVVTYDDERIAESYNLNLDDDLIENLGAIFKAVDLKMHSSENYVNHTLSESKLLQLRAQLKKLKEIS